MAKQATKKQNGNGAALGFEAKRADLLKVHARLALDKIMLGVPIGLVSGIGRDRRLPFGIAATVACAVLGAALRSGPSLPERQ